MAVVVPYTFLKPRRNDDLLHQEISALGIAGFKGISGRAGEAIFQVQFSRALTNAEEGRVSTVVSLHAGAPRRPRTVQALAEAILALGAADRARVIAACCAVVLREHPDLARRIGVAFDGDEEVP